MVGLRALLRKRYTIFQKLPNGKYGLTAWYPDAKKPKTAAAGTPVEDDADDDDDEMETAAAQDDPDEAAVA